VKHCKIALMLLTTVVFVSAEMGATSRIYDLPAIVFPDDVVQALEKAGKNRDELQRVLVHYSQTRDSLELRAAYFLIGDMDGHSYITYQLKDTAGNVVDFDALSYPNYDSLTADFKRLEAKHGTLDFERKETLEDLETISAEFLIKQIESAFNARSERPWTKKLTFDQFCEYVLPYRGSNEPLEDWREIFVKKYQDLPNKMVDPTDPIEAAKLINKDVMTWFTFDERYYYHPTDQGITEMLANHKGRCEDMTNATIYAMRANALAVTSDYTPFWADYGNNHAWNAIIAPDGKAIPFMGAEANPGDYRLSHRFAKVYRKTYSKQMQNLVFQPHKQEKLAPSLAGKNYKDVTAEYGPVCTVTRTLSFPAPDTIDIAYICVFNEGEWKPIHWGRRTENGSVTFTDMAKNVALLVGLYIDGEIKPLGDPFLIRDDCSVQALEAAQGATTRLELTTTTARVLEVSTDGVSKKPPTPGTEYELFYWQDGWKSLGKTTAGSDPLLFDKIPTGCLYWLVATGSDKDERIFTIEDGKQVWW
jgi:hypothetical protein